MRRLSDTIERLSKLRAQCNIPGGGTDDGRLSHLHNFGSNPGALGARTYVPEDLPEGAPLVVVLHGCTQTAEGYDRGTGWSVLADQQGFALLFPEQQRANNPNLCFNWFVPEDTRRNGGEALSIWQMIEALVRSHALDRTRIFITGLSAGGAMTSVMLATYPEIFAGGAIIAGLPHGTASTIPEAFDRMRGHGSPSERELQRRLRKASPHDGPWPTISIWHGTADQTVASSNARAIVDQWRIVHGVDTAARSESVAGHSRKVWCDARGRDVIEEYSISGMGHGTPLSTAGGSALGKPGPFMLDVGVSSTVRIAEFWGLMKSTGRIVDLEPVAAQTSTRFALAPAPPSRGKRSSASGAEEQGRPETPSTIQKTIEDALRSAGLMR